MKEIATYILKNWVVEIIFLFLFGDYLSWKTIVFFNSRDEKAGDLLTSRFCEFGVGGLLKLFL